MGEGPISYEDVRIGPKAERNHRAVFGMDLAKKWLEFLEGYSLELAKWA